ncbi:MAG: CRISPR-associated helicase Cas3' [Deltaproteobacteria bacterium]|nr:CRISPR-associated helicase Cas3' [Deltaproteobacteria bacterium]
MEKELLAHIRKDENDEWLFHYLKEHLEGTATLAEKFAVVFGLNTLADIVGKVHDYGKASQAFQDKIAGKSGYDPTAHVNLNVDHATAGAQFLVEKYEKRVAIPLAYVVAGHHGGLPNGKDENYSSLSRRLKKPVEEYLSRVPSLPLPEKILLTDFMPLKRAGKHDRFSFHFLIRMLYSVLTDADSLNTEEFMTPDVSAERQSDTTIAKLHDKLEQHLATFKPDKPINEKRAQILNWCREFAQQEQGIFSLSVPTGGGKTISSMAFALDHAKKYKLRRIIYIIPYTSIIVQNAEVFREILGDGAVLEHHSNLEPKRATPQNRLASQNWDAPIVVTTNVQFFESFYGNRSSACRKLHNVADSVLIFDEAQMFPPEFLRPSLAVIRELTKSYGCTAVLCTATQPTLNNASLLKREALEGVREIVPDPQQLYEEFRRVDVTVIDEPQSYDMLGKKIAEQKQILVIVNTRKDARQIFEQLIEHHPAHECFHLSTMLCPAHRSVTLKAIRVCLDKGLPCRVVSTQLIEAGVDVDFPVVWRAIAGLDSIAQAAGRCNREGKAERGKVFVFQGETPPPIGYLRQAAESGQRILESYHDDPLSLAAVKRYFEDFFWKQNNAHEMDKKEIMQMCKRPPDAIPFREIAAAFKIIDEPTRSIIIPYQKTGEQVIEKLKKCRFHAKHPGYVNRELRKKLQRYTVQLRERVFRELYGVLDDVFQDEKFFVLINEDIYTENVGLNPENPVFMEVESLII